MRVAEDAALRQRRPTRHIQHAKLDTRKRMGRTGWRALEQEPAASARGGTAPTPRRLHRGEEGLHLRRDTIHTTVRAALSLSPAEAGSTRDTGTIRH